MQDYKDIRVIRIIGIVAFKTSVDPGSAKIRSLQPALFSQPCKKIGLKRLPLDMGLKVGLRKTFRLALLM